MKIDKIAFTQPVQVPGAPGLRDRTSSATCEITLEDNIVRLEAGADVVCVPIGVVLCYVPATVTKPSKKGKS
jgi:hypothetical protein